MKEFQAVDQIEKNEKTGEYGRVQKTKAITGRVHGGYITNKETRIC